MSRRFNRRQIAALLTGMAAAGPSWATAPQVSLRPKMRPLLPPKSPIRNFFEKSGLKGEFGCAAAALADGRLLSAENQTQGFAPASVAKTITAAYALYHLGADYRFRTELAMTGTLTDGVLDGDLILIGGGDPTLTTDRLAELAKALSSTGITQITGQFLYHHGGFSPVHQIDPDQPIHLGYNPSVAGLNLNFNRVFFEWTRNGQSYDFKLEARDLQFRPKANTVRMTSERRGMEVFKYAQTPELENWSVARSALGKGGGRWLPVRRPGTYTADVFHSLARHYGVALPMPQEAMRVQAHRRLCHIDSTPLSEILVDMLKHSVNLTAEGLGRAATRQSGGDYSTLKTSARHMQEWAARQLNMPDAQFVDHSGLGDRARITAQDMVRALVAAQQLMPSFPALLRRIKPRDTSGNLDRNSTAVIHAKTGTLHFVSALAGYVSSGVDTPYAFAVFTQNLERRARLTIWQRESSKAADYWNQRARYVQYVLLARWSKRG